MGLQGLIKRLKKLQETDMKARRSGSNESMQNICSCSVTCDSFLTLCVTTTISLLSKL